MVMVKKFKNTSNKVVALKAAGRSYLLDDNLIKKVKDIAIGTGAAYDVINRKQILNIVKGVNKPKNLNSLKKFVGTLELTN